jgi:GNAT superfamily N-acetyltransferase
MIWTIISSGIDVLFLNKTSSYDPDFGHLIGMLDQELWRRYPHTNQDYVKYNILKPGARVVVAYAEGEPVGCGCFREAGLEKTIEIKRMYVVEQMRKRGIAMAILAELEGWAVQLGWGKAVLETGINQPEAISLYTKAGYMVIPNYGPYTGMSESVCMSKDLRR